MVISNQNDRETELKPETRTVLVYHRESTVSMV